jgi:hypothetical protein
MYFATLLFQILAVSVLIIFAYFTKGVEFPFNQFPSLIGAFILINILEYSIVFLLTSFEEYNVPKYRLDDTLHSNVLGWFDISARDVSKIFKRNYLYL